MDNCPINLPVASVEVALWGCVVGFVHQSPLGYVFEYESTFMDKAWNLEPLSVSRTPSSPSEETGLGLPVMLSDCLPDEFGLGIIRAHLANHRHPKMPASVLDYLALLGRSAIGALEFSPVLPVDRHEHDINITDIVHSCLDMQQKPATPCFREALERLLPLGISAGGQRAKIVVAYDQVSSRFQDPGLDLRAGFSHWLVKLDGVAPASKNNHTEPGAPGGFGRVEYAYHLMARAAGIKMSDCALFEEQGRAHFLTRRFDRAGSDKIMVQSLCAMAQLDYKERATHDYNDLFSVMSRLDLPASDLQEAFRRMVFNVLAFNCDDHTKNFAFTMDQSGVWRLSPAYDITFAYNPQSYWVNQHLMGVNGKFKDIAKKDLLAFAFNHAVDDAPAILADVAQAVSSWSEFANQASVPSSLRLHVLQYLNPPKTLK